MIVRTLLLVSGLSLLLLGLFHSLAPNRYQATARVDFRNSPGPNSYEDEVKFIRSDKILGKAREQVGLPKKWGSNPNKPDFQQVLWVNPIRGNGMVEIVVAAGKPDDAAKIANAIAAAGQNLHQEPAESGQPTVSWAVLDTAMPPSRPFFPNHYLGIASLLAGGLLLGGWWYVGTWKGAQNHHQFHDGNRAPL